MTTAISKDDGVARDDESPLAGLDNSALFNSDRDDDDSPFHQTPRPVATLAGDGI